MIIIMAALVTFLLFQNSSCDSLVELVVLFLLYAILHEG